MTSVAVMGRAARPSRASRALSMDPPLPPASTWRHALTVLARRAAVGGHKSRSARGLAAPCRAAAAADRLGDPWSGEATTPHAKVAEPRTRGRRWLRAARPSALGA